MYDSRTISKRILVVILAVATLIAFTPMLTLSHSTHAATEANTAAGGVIDSSTATKDSVAKCLGVRPDSVKIHTGARKEISVRLWNDVVFAKPDTTVTVAKDNELHVDLNGYDMYSADASTADMFSMEQGAALRLYNGQGLPTDLVGSMIMSKAAAQDANIVEATGTGDDDYSQSIMVGQGVTIATASTGIDIPAAIKIDSDGTTDFHTALTVNGTVSGGHKNVGAIIMGQTALSKATIDGFGTAVNNENDYAIQTNTYNAAYSKKTGSSITAVVRQHNDYTAAVGVEITPVYYQSSAEIEDKSTLENDMFFQWYRYDAKKDVMTPINGATNYCYTPTKADKGYYLRVEAWMKSEYNIGFGCGCSSLMGLTIDTKTINNIKYMANKSSAAGVSGVGKNAKSYTIAKTANIGGKTLKVTFINAKAFEKATKCKTVTIKSTSINKIGKNAFKKCQKGMTFKLPKAKYKTYKKLMKGKVPAGTKYKIL